MAYFKACFISPALLIFSSAPNTEKVIMFNLCLFSHRYTGVTSYAKRRLLVLCAWHMIRAFTAMSLRLSYVAS